MIDCDSAADVAIVRLRHGKVNALDIELLDELVGVLGDIDDSVRAVVLTGNGRVFSAGVDLARVVAGRVDYVQQLIPALSRAFVALFTFPRPTVAAIDGAAIAGGCILAAACDRRLMANGSAIIGATEVGVGVPFPCAALEILRHACGAHTEDIVLRARRLEVASAVAVGLVHQAAAAEEVVETAIAVAAELGQLPSEAYAMAKSQLRRVVVERIERDGPAIDRTVAAAWSSEDTLSYITDQLERLRRR